VGLEFLLLFCGLAGVVISAWVLVGSASKIAHILSIPEYVIGFTLIAFGTSAPEIVVSVMSVLKGNGDLALGNALGSNIANIGLALSLGLLLAGRNLKIQPGSQWVELPIILFLHFLLWLFTKDLIGLRWEGALLFSVTLFLLGVLYRQNSIREWVEQEEKSDRFLKTRALFFPGLLVLASFVSLYISSEVTVDNAVSLALVMGISHRIIGVTILAVGTSMPEIATVIMSCMKGRYGISLGTIFGSNLINIGVVMGLAMLTKPFTLMDISFQSDLLISALVTLTIIPLVLWGQRFPKFIGSALLIGYGFYMWTIFKSLSLA
jgi:cation:H+ antiporter